MAETQAILAPLHGVRNAVTVRRSSAKVERTTRSQLLHKLTRHGVDASSLPVVVAAATTTTILNDIPSDRIV